MSIKRVDYYNEISLNIEINTISNFFQTRPRSMIEKDYRLNFWILIYITKGEGIHSIDFKEYPYVAGDLIVIPKNRIHSFRVNHEVEGYIININESYFFEYGIKFDIDTMSFFEAPPDKPIMKVDIRKTTTNRQLIDLLYKEYLSADIKYRKDLIKALFVSFIYSIRNENKEKIRYISDTSYRHYYEYKELVEENFKELKKVSDYAKLMGLSKKTINAACRECVDISAKQLIINRIILEAKRLIALDKMKNYEISNMLGFDEPANFSAFFKRNCGINVSDFRKNYKKDN